MNPISIIYIISATLLGAIVGSFLNVVILRLPAGGSIAYPPSHCPRCKAQLSWYDNIPILSYIFILNGKCRHCRIPISVQYPIVEALMALASMCLMIFLKPSLTFGIWFFVVAIGIVATGIFLNKERY